MFPNCFLWKGMGRIKNQNTQNGEKDLHTDI